MSKPSVVVYHHMGLGDHIVCNGLVRTLAENNNVRLLCKYKNINNVSFMYRDNPNIELIGIDNDNDANSYCDNNNGLRCGFGVGGTQYPNVLWDETFYLNANIPFDHSWSKFHYERDTDHENQLFNKLVPQGQPFVFIHHTDSTGADRINWDHVAKDKLNIISDERIGFFSYTKIIELADEVHCVNSSYKHLADRIFTKGKLFFHKNMRPRGWDEYHSKKEWIIV